MARIGIFGAGYVGLVTGACFAELGHDVVVRDVVPEKIAELAGGRVPIYEPGLEELIAKNSERLRFTLDVREAIEGAELLFVCVGTPPTLLLMGYIAAAPVLAQEPPPVQPQQDVATVTVVGQVLDRLTGEPVAGALVEILTLHERTLTGEHGQFLLRGIEPGDYEIGVERLGYELTVVPVTLDGDRLTIELEPKPAVLEGLEVTVDRMERRRRAATWVFRRPGAGAGVLCPAARPGGGGACPDRIAATPLGGHGVSHDAVSEPRPPGARVPVR